VGGTNDAGVSERGDRAGSIPKQNANLWATVEAREATPLPALVA